MSEPLPADFPQVAKASQRVARSQLRRTAFKIAIAILALALLAIVIWKLAATANRPVRAVEADKIAAPAHVPVRSQPTTVLKPAPVWERSVVTIESAGGSDRRIVGSGFFIDGNPCVVTSLHVMRDCTEARVRLLDETAYEVTGFAAVDPAHDLAVLALESAPTDVVGLKLARATAKRRDKIWAIGHPDGVAFSISAGEISSVIRSAELPVAARTFLRGLTAQSTNSEWLQHTAPIAGGSSGGPLINQEGQVVGINAWIDREARFAYSVPARAIETLTASAADSKPQPLSKFASTEARVTAEAWAMSASRLRSLLEKAEAMKWKPTSDDDYRVLQQLAWAITLARAPDALAARGDLGNRLEELAKAADEAIARLRKQKWNDLAQITLINEQASGEVNRKLSGLICFATVQRVVQSPQGGRGAILILAGFDQLLFIPLEGELTVPAVNAQCVLIGVNFRGRIVQWGDNPLELQSAPVIMPGVILEMER